MNGFYQIRQTTLRLKGVSGVHPFWHVSDTHLSAIDSQATFEEIQTAFHDEFEWLKIRRMFAERFQEPFGEAQQQPSGEAFAQLVDLCLEQKAEALLMSGDMVNTPLPASYRLIRRQLQRLEIPALYAPGNHEENWFEDEHTLPFRDGENIQLYRGDGFTIAAMDNSRKRISPLQLEQLNRLCTEGKPIVLLLHAPLRTRFNREQVAQLNPYYLVDESDCDSCTVAMIRECVRPDSPVRAILCGHVHGWHQSEFALGKPQLCASSGLVGFAHRVMICGE